MFSQRQKRRCSIRIWILIINDSFKKSSRAFTGLGPSEEPGELIVENVPLKWVLEIHWFRKFIDILQMNFDWKKSTRFFFSKLWTSNLIPMNSASLGSRKNVECFQTPEWTWIYLIISMLMTKVGDEMCWWQLINAGDDVTNITVTVYLRLLWLKTLTLKLK